MADSPPPLDFLPLVIYSSGGPFAASVDVADVNGDGKPDLVVANDCPIGCSPEGLGVVGVLLCNGDGTFQSAVPYSSGGSIPDSVALRM